MIGALLLFAFAPVPEATLNELEDAAKHFREAALMFASDVQHTVAQRYATRKAGISRAYEDKIQELEIEERTKRGNAIASFEAFLRKHPHELDYSPDAMFRLAELYFERSNDTYLAAMRRFEDEAAKNENARAPKQDYTASIALYRQLIAHFSDYRLLDGAHYLLGYCLGEQGDDKSATEEYLRLVERFPASRFVTEAWTRIGEHYFDEGALALAAVAYQHVLEAKGSSFYDKALYKLGWTYFRMDRLDEAVARFVELVDSSAGELRTEALQYLGISFAEERWGNLQKAKAFFEKTPKPWANEVYTMLGDVYFDQSKYSDAIAAYELALKAAPRDRNAPKLRDKEIAAFERMRDFDGAARARELIGTDFAEGTQWDKANERDTDATASARELAQKALLAAALFYHRQAQSSKEQKKDAASAYALAAQSYDKYLRRFPSARNRYELTYALADCQYYAAQFANAAASYGRVAEDDSNDQYREAAAFSAVLAAEKHVQAQEARGALAQRPVLTSAQRKAAPQKSPLPPERAALIAACDRYVARANQSEKTAPIMFKAAESEYVYDRFDEARPRLLHIIDAYPKAEVARFAANLMIESYLAEKDWDAVERFSAEAARKLGGSEQLEKFRLGAMFKKAEALEAKGAHEQAAAEYLLLLAENPRSELADKALNNAAVDYEKARRFESASKLYERLARDYPQSPLADTALFRVGLNAERFYDFDKAIAAYQKLVDDYPKSAKRPDALYNAALALENTQRYSRAIDEYRRYATLFPDRPDAADVFFRAGRAAETSGDKRRAIALNEAFIARYQKKAKASDERVVEAYLRIGVLDGDKRALTLAVREAAKRGAGVAFAAQAQFRAAELAFAAYDAVAIEGGSRAQKAAIVKRATLLKKASEAYQAVFAFKQVEWTLAALYRLGALYEAFADKLFAAPVPPEVKKMGAEYAEEYRVLIEEQAVPLEDKAVEAYKRVLAEAKKSGVANAWTKRTLKSLNKLRKNEYPLQKEARQPVEGFSLLDPLGTEKKVRLELRAHPTDLALREQLVATLVAQGRLEEAEKGALEILHIDEKHAGAMLNLSRIYAAQNKKELATLAANNAREIAPQRADVLHQVGLLALARNERPQALALFKKASELDPLLVASQLNVALLCGEAADFDGALAAAEAAEAAAPSPQTRLALGNAYRGVQRYRDAEAAYSQLITRDAANADALYNRAILFLDAEIPELDLLTRLERAAADFDAFSALPGISAEERATAASFATQARRRVDTEKKKREREEKRKAKS